MAITLIYYYLKKDKDKIVASISSLNERTDIKQKSIELENALK
jgi:hypothetical protein